MPVISTPVDAVGPRPGSCTLTRFGPGRMSAIANLPSVPVTAVSFSLAAGCEYRYLRSGHRFTGSRAYDTGPRRRRRRTLLCFKRDRDHQSQQQTPLYQSEGLMKGSSYCVFLCVAEFIHDKFPRVKTECNRVHEGLQRKRRLPARARIVRRCQEQAERSSAQPLRFTYL